MENRRIMSHRKKCTTTTLPMKYPVPRMRASFSASRTRRGRRAPQLKPKMACTPSHIPTTGRKSRESQPMKAPRAETARGPLYFARDWLNNT